MCIRDRNYSEAVSLLAECLEYPHHLGEGKLHGAQENDFYYFMGCAYEGLGQNDKAVECWEQAIVGPTEPAAAMYYNDAKPDKIFYQGLALLKLNRMDEACLLYTSLAFVAHNRNLPDGRLQSGLVLSRRSAYKLRREVVG